MSEEKELFQGYALQNSKSAIRNHTIVYATDGLCVNIAQKISQNVQHSKLLYHPYGRGQVGEDKKCSKTITNQVLTHPNVSGVVLVGFEQGDLNEWQAFIQEHHQQVVSIPVYQSGDRTSAIHDGMNAAARLVHVSSETRRQVIPINQLKIGIVSDKPIEDGESLLSQQLLRRFDQVGIEVCTSAHMNEHTPEEMVTFLNAEHCHMIMHDCLNMTYASPITPVLRMSNLSHFGIDLYADSDKSMEESIEQLIRKIQSIASGEKTYSEILVRDQLWFPRMEPSI